MLTQPFYLVTDPTFVAIIVSAAAFSVVDEVVAVVIVLSAAFSIVV